jgi:hypothetical protein
LARLAHWHLSWHAQVAVELTSGHLTITQPREIAMYAQRFARLAETAAYGARARDLIAALTPEQ